MLRNYFQNKLDQKIKRGIIVIDKEAGITSHDEVDRLRRIFGTRRVGHSGTLDPKVTGVLVCGLGQGTKVLEYVLLSEKIYDCQIIFHQKISRQGLLRVMGEFTGTITQLPPVRSRVKRVERNRTVYGLELLSFARDGRKAQIRCRVERGTYIRKLCHDLGQTMRDDMGSPIGAHMGDLRRIQAGPISLTNTSAVRTTELQRLKKKVLSPFLGWWYLWQLGRYVLPIERVLEQASHIVVDESLRDVISSGTPLYGPGVVEVRGRLCVEDMVTVGTSNGEVWAVGIAKMHGDDLRNKRKGVAVELDKVLV